MKIAKVKSAVTVFAAAFLVAGFAMSNMASATVPAVNEYADIDASNNYGNGYVGLTAISQDGRYTAFSSNATNLVSSDTNGKSDIFVRDRVADTVTRVSVSTSGTQSNDTSTNPRISSNGRYVIFQSVATNLVSGSGNKTSGEYGIYLHDLNAGTTELVDKSSTGTAANAASQYADVSNDGQYVVFGSLATNLTSDTLTSGANNVFVKNRKNGTVTLLSKNASGAAGNNSSFYPHIDCSGRFVVFNSSATNLVSGDTNGYTDVFLADRLDNTGLTNVTISANGHSSGQADINCKGDFVGFSSEATNLVSGDTNNVTDVFLYDVQSSSFERVSVSGSGGQTDSDSGTVSISADGRYVAFDSSATNLVSGSTGGNTQAYLRDRQNGTTEVLSVNSSSQLGNNFSGFPAISANGTYIAMYSQASNIISGGDTTSRSHVIIAQTGYDPY